VRRIVALITLAMGALVVLAAPASAHASLESTEPASGAVLDDAPDRIELRFTESVQVDDDSVRLFDASGARVETGGAQHPEGRVVVVPLGALDDGGYVVAWKVVSADGHPIGGGFTFRVGDAGTAVDPSVVSGVLASQSTSRAVGVAAGVVRFAVFASLLVLVGALGFVVLVAPALATEARLARLVWSSWGVLLAATVVGIGVQGAELDGLGLADALKPSVFGDTLDTTFGAVWLVRAVALVPAAVVLLRLRDASRAWWRAAAATVGLVLVATPAFSGHADTGRWLEVAKGLDVTHLAAGALWVGGLAVLLLVVLRDDGARAVVERFSALAFGCVAVVVATGTVQAVRQVRSLDELETAYGRWLLVKLVIVLVLIGLASLTRSALHGRMPASDERRSLRRLVGAEVAIALAVLGATAFLVDADPTGAERVAAGPYNETRVVGTDVLVNVVAVPGTVGPTDFHVYVDNPSGGLTPPVDLVGTLALDGGEIVGVDVRFVDAGVAHWSANDVDLPIAGTWTLSLQIYLTDVDSVRAEFSIPIGGAA
jgi:copper transport protein